MSLRGSQLNAVVSALIGLSLLLLPAQHALPFALLGLLPVGRSDSFPGAGYGNGHDHGARDERRKTVWVIESSTEVWWFVLLPILLTVCDEKTKSSFLKLNFSISAALLCLFRSLRLLPLEHAPLELPHSLVDSLASAAHAGLHRLLGGSLGGHALPLLLPLRVGSERRAPLHHLAFRWPKGSKRPWLRTPRPWWCVISYSGILGIYGALFWLFSHPNGSFPPPP